MNRRFIALVMGTLATLSCSMNRAEPPSITAGQVRDSIRLASEYLISQQSKTKGNWPEHQGQPGGVTALCTLALLEAGVSKDHPSIVRAVEHLRSLEPKMTYATSLQTMVFCALGEKRDIPLIRDNVRWLESAQITRLSDRRHGSWTYSDRDGKGDNSNTQFALLALHEASQAGIAVRKSTWEDALSYWLRCQNAADGSFGYVEGHPPTGSMTCAGISSLIITMEKLDKFNQDAVVKDGNVQCCGEGARMDRLDMALDWMGRKFDAIQNPVPAEFQATLGNTHRLYYYYGLERVGRLSGQRFFVNAKGKRRDWYREIAAYLAGAEMQDPLTGKFQNVGYGERDPRIATAFALLFLSKGRRPVVMSKYKYTNDREWNLHRRGVHNLAQSLERRWKQRLTWQTIEARAATVNDLLETPVLFISGRKKLDLRPKQKETLKEYINQGGFIFAEACDGATCRDEGFRESFIALMAELFRSSQWRKLEDTHPIYYAEQRVFPSVDGRVLEGLDACCRTSVVLCPSTLSCYWDLKPVGIGKEYPEPIQKTIDECVALGQNVLAYATNREVKAKLERPKVISSTGLDKDRKRGTLNVAKINHNGGGNDAPNALANLLNVARNDLDMNETISLRTRLISPDDVAMFEYPILFIHGRREFRFTATQRKAIAAYIKRGGFIFGDAICASPQFAESFRLEMQAIFPDAKLLRMPADHPIFTSEYRGYNIRNVTLRTPSTAGDSEALATKLSKTVPYLQGLKVDERLAVIFSPYDISCAMENSASLECKGYIKEDAAKIGLNILLFALQQ